MDKGVKFSGHDVIVESSYGITQMPRPHFRCLYLPHSPKRAGTHSRLGEQRPFSSRKFSTQIRERTAWQSITLTLPPTFVMESFRQIVVTLFVWYYLCFHRPTKHWWRWLKKRRIMSPRKRYLHIFWWDFEFNLNLFLVAFIDFVMHMHNGTTTT